MKKKINKNVFFNHNLAKYLFQEPSLPSYQEKAVAAIGLLSERPHLPLNLAGPMSEEEQRVWQKGANSDTSLRLYKNVSPFSLMITYLTFQSEHST